MVTDRNRPAAKAQQWHLQWVTRSPIFEPFSGVASRLPATKWPDIEVLNAMLEERESVVSNAAGKPVRFVEQVARPSLFEEEFEPRACLRGEVLVRPQSWHDLFNALVWMTFPMAKAIINARHYSSLRGHKGKQRSAAGDALTLFDEDGMVVLSTDERLLELIRQFRWKELFRECRQDVRNEMRFVVFGHAMYEKALRPFVGMTAKSILLQVPVATLDLSGADLNAEIDRRVAAYLRNPHRLTHGKSLAPLPVLGIPGWWPQNEMDDFYDDVSYFRPGRSADESSKKSSIS